jgi:hypothetical protein
MREMTPTISLESRYGQAIRNMKEWHDRRKAVNAGWVPGKSAWETANAWVGTGRPLVPDEFRQLLDSHELSAGIHVERGIVERKTALRYGGGPRNHDVVLFGARPGTKCVIGVESKADDGFAGSVQEQLRLAAARHEGNERSNRDLRAHWLSHCLMGVHLLDSSRCHLPCRNDENDFRFEIRELPFQLFAGVAGTMLEAQVCHADVAIFVVHQFRTHFTDDDEIDRDARLLDRFVFRLLESTALGMVAHMKGCR